MDDEVISSLEAVVEARPEDLPLRLHLADLLIAAGRGPEAVRHAAAALAVDPDSPPAREVMARALGPASGGDPESVVTSGTVSDAEAAPPADGRRATEFDWGQAEQDLDSETERMFVDEPPGDTPPAFDTESAGIRLSDVGGLKEVKDRLNASFLAPLRNPKLRELYAKSLRGGLLLYGPPGCGKTYLARAVAGELGASFLTVSLADILDMFVGNSEKNVHELFETARAAAPCVLFLDELDALGQKRSLTRNSGTRGTVNQLLSEMDGVGSRNDGVYVLAATNHPWEVDPAFRRPGRLDRMLLVLPPDGEAREAILRHHLSNRPIEGIDVRKLAKRTDGYSGADLAHVCESAAELALLDSARSGTARMIGMRDLEHALDGIRPSVGPWLDVARNVTTFANEGGEYDELARYLRKRERGR